MKSLDLRQNPSGGFGAGCLVYRLWGVLNQQLKKPELFCSFCELICYKQLLWFHHEFCIKSIVKIKVTMFAVKIQKMKCLYILFIIDGQTVDKKV